MIFEMVKSFLLSQLFNFENSLTFQMEQFRIFYLLPNYLIIAIRATG